MFSLVHSGEGPWSSRRSRTCEAPVRYLDEPGQGMDHVRRQLGSFALTPLRSGRALLDCLLRPRLASGYGESSALRCLSHALSIAAVVRDMRVHGDEPVRVHAHFAHDPALVGMLAARLTGLPFSFTGHARDLFEIPPESLAARAHEATAVVTCCAANAAYVVGGPGTRQAARAGGPPRRRPAAVRTQTRCSPTHTPVGPVGRPARREEGVPPTCSVRSAV